MSTMQRATSDGPLVQFFAEYPQFEYDRSKAPTKEFQRMCRLVRLVPRSDERKAAQEAFNNAIALEFNDAFGTDENSLESWQALCERLQIDPIPDTLNECRRVVKSTHVNLVDMVDRNEEVPEKFPSVAALRQYSIENHKIFPKENAYAGGLLKNLLREFFNAHRGRHGHGRRGRGGGRGRGRGVAGETVV
ncbi:hypothetical protein CVT25_006123 [Psilocybe cyanescens]|uniref:Uncharacterized protein n=1 Tax=Psilocybe cyanescens TaxID=93625 RepID=A0A409WZ12_PSICY|nr:hypothetical protein CVT25_006123 [Psilocybe cyanescens]